MRWSVLGLISICLALIYGLITEHVQLIASLTIVVIIQARYIQCRRDFFEIKRGDILLPLD